MANLFCVFNQKGGVGKTTIGINTAAGLNQLGRDVLLVDLDPQGSATEGLGFLASFVTSPSLLDVLTNPRKRKDIGSIICSHAEMDLLPANLDTTAVESDLATSPRPSQQLELALDPLKAQYDYIVVDCPPSFGLLTDNALYATRNILIPVLTESTSKRALEHLFEHIETMELKNGFHITELGVVANRIESTNEADHMLEWIQSVFPDIPVWEIRKRVAFQYAFSQGGSIYQYNPELDMAERFLTIANSINDQFAASEPRRTE